MAKQKFYICVEWVDVFGDKHEFETYCTNEKSWLKQIEETNRQFRNDPFVDSFKVNALKRKG